MEKKTAKLIKNLKRPDYGFASLYKCNPPLEGENYVVASSVDCDGYKECLLLAAASTGAIAQWCEIGGRKNLETLDGSHELAFKSMGYEVVR